MSLMKNGRIDYICWQLKSDMFIQAIINLVSHEIEKNKIENATISARRNINYLSQLLSALLLILTFMTDISIRMNALI